MRIKDFKVGKINRSVMSFSANDVRRMSLCLGNTGVNYSMLNTNKEEQLSMYESFGYRPDATSSPTFY
jgi:hypothetical protein